ncbi:MAG: alpha/beta hydrolase [Planctomycetaceae bacterium]|nr:alpha/beta hydrolase [Planctomycetaceae bacterium]
MTRAPQLVLLPGLGADFRLLEEQRKAFPDLVVPPWLPPRRHESLSDYAARMADVLAASCRRPLVIGGVSFGGMLAYEMAHHLKPSAVILIASCRSRQGLRWAYRAGRRLWPMVPVWTWNAAKRFSLPSVRLSRRLDAQQRTLLTGMFREIDNRFLHWTVHAILGWKPEPLDGTPIFQIHGRRDLVLPARRSDADEWIPDGRHLINVTHAPQVNAFIAKVISNVAASARVL